MQECLIAENCMYCMFTLLLKAGLPTGQLLQGPRPPGPTRVHWYKQMQYQLSPALISTSCGLFCEEALSCLMKIWF